MSSADWGLPGPSSAEEDHLFRSLALGQARYAGRVGAVSPPPPGARAALALQECRYRTTQPANNRRCISGRAGHGAGGGAVQSGAPVKPDVGPYAYLSPPTAKLLLRHRRRDLGLEADLLGRVALPRDTLDRIQQRLRLGGDKGRGQASKVPVPPPRRHPPPSPRSPPPPLPAAKPDCPAEAEPQVPAEAASDAPPNAVAVGSSSSSSSSSCSSTSSTNNINNINNNNKPSCEPDGEHAPSLDIFELKLTKPECRSVVGSYMQRTIPFRSASFSQVDYSSIEGKYFRRRNIPAAADQASSTLPRKKEGLRPQSPADEERAPEDAAGQDPAEERRRDKSRRRKGMYIAQWPDVEPGPKEVPRLQVPPLQVPPLQVPPLQVPPLQVPPGGEDEASEGEECPDRLASPTFPASDVSDTEGRPRSAGEPLSPRSPHRYSKRPLRGPYGQMLEAEMKKPDAGKAFSTKHSQELKFLDAGGEPSDEHKAKSRKARSASNRSFDDSQLKAAALPKRKASVDTAYPAALAPDRAYHQRTTSSPSKLEGLGPEPSTALLAALLRGSSEHIAADRHSDTAFLSKCLLRHNDTRTHVVVELFDTERSYVESLEIIVMKYLEPLKSPENAGLLDTTSVDEIFYQVPPLLTHHQIFLEELRKRLDHWDMKQIVGDIFLDVFTKPAVVEAYTAFIGNWKRAKEIIKSASQSKPAFAKFLEAMAREHKGKLPLDSLLIKPIQKFPKYELLIQRLIKHTDQSHPDYQLLLVAQREVHDFLLKMNCTERETLEMEQQQQTLKELQGLVEGLVNLVAADRTFLRHDLVTMTVGQAPSKERALFLFSDLLLITSIKRRSGTIKKPASGSSCPGSVTSSLDANKYKLLMRIPLDDLEIMKAKDENLRRMMAEIENLTEDITVLNQINELTWSLHCAHGPLDDLVKDMLGSLNKQLLSSDSQLSYLELTLNTANGLENVSLVFSKPEKRASWEECFTEAKHKLALSADKRPCPEFMGPVPIRKTRAGLQFTCASPTLSCAPSGEPGAPTGREVWVCNSDGYVGQVCVLRLHPEPAVTSCNGVCNARIICVASVPAGVAGSAARDAGKDAKDDKDESIKFESSSSSEEDEASEAEGAEQRSLESKPSSRCKSFEATSTDSLDEPDHLQSTMWLGTEDGCIHVYNCGDNIRIKKNKIRLQHGSAVQCIIYLDNKVFVSLANGDLAIYVREPKTGWNTSSPATVSVGTATSPAAKMLPISGRLWCGCGNTIRVFNTHTLAIEHAFQVNNDQNLPVTGLAVSGFGVWVSLQYSATIGCFHSVTYDCLCEVNVASSVTKMLTSCDDIIRQHKVACLRVTALLACKDLLWIGTSAGVILTMPLPHITASTAKVAVIPSVTGVPFGHTGHVRFLTSVESADCRKGKPEKAGSPRLLVISGGDGFEDFRSSNISEVAGREDSTNYLLLWNV